MNKQFFNAMVAGMLVASMPLTIGAVKPDKSKKKVRIQLVRSELSKLKKELEGLDLPINNRLEIARYLNDYLHNSEKKMPRLATKNEQEVVKIIIQSHNDILNTPGNHKKAAKNYINQAIGTVITFSPALALTRPSRSAEPAKKIMKKTDPTIDDWRGERKGTTGLAGQLPGKTKATTLTKASTDIMPVSRKGAKEVNVTRGDARPHEYKKSAAQVQKEKKERAQKRADKKAKKAKKLAAERKAA